FGPQFWRWNKFVPVRFHVASFNVWRVVPVSLSPFRERFSGLGVPICSAKQTIRRVGDHGVDGLIGQGAQDGETVAVQDITHHGDHPPDPQPHASHAHAAPTAHPPTATTSAPPASHATPGTTPATPTTQKTGSLPLPLHPR